MACAVGPGRSLVQGRGSGWPGQAVVLRRLRFPVAPWTCLACELRRNPSVPPVRGREQASASGTQTPGPGGPRGVLRMAAPLPRGLTHPVLPVAAAVG